MKKILLGLSLIAVCVLLTGCDNGSISLGSQFVVIEQDGNLILFYDRDTKAVYMAYKNGRDFSITPYIMFDEYNQLTVGQWNGEKIVPAELEFNETYMIMGKGGGQR